MVLIRSKICALLQVVGRKLDEPGHARWSFLRTKICALVYESWVESLTNLGPKDGLFKDKDLCFGYKSWAEGWLEETGHERWFF